MCHALKGDTRHTRLASHLTHLLPDTNNPYAADGYHDIDVIFNPMTAATWMVDSLLDIDVGARRGDGLSGPGS